LRKLAACSTLKLRKKIQKSSNNQKIPYFPGPQKVETTAFLKQRDLNTILRIIIANYDKTGLRFPIQKLILGPRALKMFGSKANSDLVSYILSRKLYDYMTNSQVSLEVTNGKAYVLQKITYQIQNCQKRLNMFAPSSLLIQ
jgi:hypothetical protein